MHFQAVNLGLWGNKGIPRKWANFSYTFMVILKGTQAWHFFYTFFAETETIWSQGPVTRDFWKSYIRFDQDIRLLNISAHAQHAMKSVPRMLSMRWNAFRVCSVCYKIRSAYAQHGSKEKKQNFVRKFTKKSKLSHACVPLKSVFVFESVRFVLFQTED
jgi:hypothetical protein